VYDLTNKFKEYLESTLSPCSMKVEEGAVLRFVNFLYDSNLRSLNYVNQGVKGKYIVPPLFIITFDRERRPSFDSRYGKGAVNLGNEYEFYKPVYLGDVISYTKKLAKFKTGAGKLGKNIVYTVETVFRNQKRQKVAVCRWTTMVFQ
jgi:hypothetical protein